MTFRKHLSDDETVLSYCGTTYWIWVCTDERIIKYRQDSDSSEQVDDISLAELSSIRTVDKGDTDWMRNSGGFLAVLGSYSMFAGLGGEPLGFLIGLVALISAGYFVRTWITGEESYFEFRGNGVIESNSTEWRLDPANADIPDEIHAFVETIRDRL
jgi:hypothetical protein